MIVDPAQPEAAHIVVKFPEEALLSAESYALRAQNMKLGK